MEKIRRGEAKMDFNGTVENWDKQSQYSKIFINFITKKLKYTVLKQAMTIPLLLAPADPFRGSGRLEAVMEFPIIWSLWLALITVTWLGACPPLSIVNCDLELLLTVQSLCWEYAVSTLSAWNSGGGWCKYVYSQS